MKFISWNVNGIRACRKHGFDDFLAAESPDFLCLQETKYLPDGEELSLDGYHQHWCGSATKGYAGVAVWSRAEPLSVVTGLGKRKHDHEGRVITAEFADFYLLSVYVPNAKRDLSRLAYRTEEWDVDFRRYCRRLAKLKPVIFAGDLNVAHTEDDLANPKTNTKNHGFTPEERAGFDSLLRAGFIDTFRQFHAGNGHYSWWPYWGTAKARNIGWRLDYFLISKSLAPRLRAADILADVSGSDHCPVRIILD